MKKFLFVFVLFICVYNTYAQIVEDFECIDMNLQLGISDDQSSLSIVENPDIYGYVNPSLYVVKYFRDKNGEPESGFWTTLDVPIDFTTNKYVHVKVMKPRISTLKFKVEGRSSGNLEVESVFPQTKINEWEDVVFDFSSISGEYTIIKFSPDFEDPLTLNEDIVIYFDDILINDQPDPRNNVTFNVDMSSPISMGNFIEGSDDCG